jgi:phosphotriesterase-related protein
MRNLVNTVLGSVSAGTLGRTLFHEHFFFGFPGFRGNISLADFNWNNVLDVGIEVARRVMARGVKTVVDVTPNECGRNPEILREISLITGLQIICATGYYDNGESSPDYFKSRQGFRDAEEEIYEMYLQEITKGIGKTDIKAGVIMVASSKGIITDYEQKLFRAAAKAQKNTGVTIITHTQGGTMGPEQAELLISHGANPERIVIGHMCCNPNVTDHIRTLRTGVCVGFDRFGLTVGTPTDDVREALLIGLIGTGYGDKLLLSHDTVNFWLGRKFTSPDAAHLKDWHITHLLDDVIPHLKQVGITDQQIEMLFVQNPQRVFGARTTSQFV